MRLWDWFYEKKNEWATIHMRNIEYNDVNFREFRVFIPKILEVYSYTRTNLDSLYVFFIDKWPIF